MVSVVPGEICVYEYCCIYDGSVTVCYGHRSVVFYLFRVFDDLFSGSVFHWLGSGGLHNIADGSASGRKCHDDQSWDYRILYFQDL